MKFEANIPSYLKTGAGSFPVGSRSAPKIKKETNFYEQAKKGFDIPITNVSSTPIFAPVGETERPSVNFFDSMQTNMDKVEPVNPFKPKPISPLPDDPTKPVNPFTPKPKEIAKTDEKTNEDIFIG